jgi:hypothetical protein
LVCVRVSVSQREGKKEGKWQQLISLWTCIFLTLHLQVVENWILAKTSEGEHVITRENKLPVVLNPG